ncbi:MAG: orotate phosphoribosyltransferase [Phycisphaerales bacterium]
MAESYFGLGPPVARYPLHMSKEALARSIADAALLRGQFTLRSGKTSSYYLDKYLFSTRPEVLGQLAPMFAERIDALEARLDIEIDRLAGAELGGIPLVTAASLATGLPSIFVRNKKKDYGTAKQVEGALEKDDVVVMLEDVATTGGQALEAVAVLREAGAKVVAVIATIDRMEGARDNIEKTGVLFESLFNVADLGVRP